jgi:cytidine deaminase
MMTYVGVRGADRELYERAVVVSQRAYAPYSRFLVGAAVRARDGRVFEGVNVENAAYPLGVCAEKAALARAVTDGCRPGDLEAIGITASPCGGCRQWLHELGLERVVYANAAGEVVAATPAELLPDTFEL